MVVVGFDFTLINAYSDRKKIEGNININNTPVIDNIKKKDLNVEGIKDVVAIEFTFTTAYEPKIGEITIKGEVLYQTDDSKKMLADWKDKKLDSKIGVTVLNTILKKCFTKAALLAEELRLPPPINYPYIEASEKGKEAS